MSDPAGLTNRPILITSPTGRREFAPAGGGGKEKTKLPSRERQTERLSPRFADVARLRWKSLWARFTVCAPEGRAAMGTVRPGSLHRTGRSDRRTDQRWDRRRPDRSGALVLRLSATSAAVRN